MHSVIIPSFTKYLQFMPKYGINMNNMGVFACIVDDHINPTVQDRMFSNRHFWCDL